MPVWYLIEHFHLLYLFNITKSLPLRSAGSRKQRELSFRSGMNSPISRFLSFVVQLWKNSVIRLSKARSEASSDAWERHLKEELKLTSTLTCTQEVGIIHVIHAPKNRQEYEVQVKGKIIWNLNCSLVSSSNKICPLQLKALDVKDHLLSHIK